jgi:g-D-glutamyl-meso-diaminopimelate peptidase
MRTFFVGKAIGTIVVLVIVVAGFGIYALLHKKPAPVVVPQPAPVVEQKSHKVIGKSIEDRAIESFTFGTGKTHLLFAGGMHGGYEWNSVLLAYGFIDYLDAHPDAIPKNVTISIIPSLNPDGVYKVVGKEGRFTEDDASKNTTVLAAGRFNAHKVDLNRNFACNWQSTSTWQSKIVSAGTAAFSEPEAKALKNYVSEFEPSAAVFWHSQSNAVYASECNEGILPGTLTIMDAYAKAAGYPAVKSFDAYKITGDAEGWLASIGIPAITVELKTHETIEWDRNLAGFKALLKEYTQ